LNLPRLAMSPVCAVCVRQEARYTCPRCQVAYCNLDCYKAHSGKCTESFYQSQVEEELRSQRATGDERKKLEKVMAGLACLDAPPDEEEEPEDGEQELSEDRLQALLELAERDELRLEDLSEEEARLFHSELKRGELGRKLGPWEPWWQRTAVVDLSSLDDDDDSDEGDDSMHRAPPPHLCCSPDGSRKAHASVALNVLEALYAYAHTMRAYNGDCSWDPLQAAAHMLHLGRGIGAHQVYTSPQEALAGALEAAGRLPGGGFGSGFDLLCLTDAATILRRGVGSCARALREAAEIITNACDAARDPKEQKVKGPAARLLRSSKKLEFLTAFAWYHEEALQSELADKAEALREAMEGTKKDEQKALNRLDWQKGGVSLPERVLSEQLSSR